MPPDNQGDERNEIPSTRDPARSPTPESPREPANPAELDRLDWEPLPPPAAPQRSDYDRLDWEADPQPPSSAEPQPEATDRLDWEPVTAPAPAIDVTPVDPAILAAHAERSRHIARGLGTWFLLLSVAGIGGLFMRQEELAAFAAISGLFIAAQAADLDRQWRTVHLLVSWVVPLSGVVAFVSLATMFATQNLAGALNPVLAAYCGASALVCALTLFPAVAGAIAARVFRIQPTSHTLRLSARMLVAGLLFAFPGWFAIRQLFESMGESIGSLVEAESLGFGLVGYVMLALAAVGFLLRRDLPAVRERLGLGSLRWSHLPVIALGVGALYGINALADLLQQRFLHSLWLEDQRVNTMIGGQLSLAGTLMLGLSAGIGEEITMRGALQPKLGIVLTALLFASLHVQYSWFGMAVIFLLGVLLGLLRIRTNTTVAMAVHTLYDIFAVLSIEQPT
jgi:hypothetical protein